MLKINDSKENVISDIFSESSSINVGLKSNNDFKSSSLRIIRLEEENSQLQKDILKQELDFNKKVETYEKKLIKFKDLNSSNQKYQQEIYDLKKRLDISIQQISEQKSMYTNENLKLRNEFENQFFELQEKNGNLQKKLDKCQQILQTKEREKSNLDQQLQIQNNKITTLLKSASNYFNFLFLSIDSFISFFSNKKNCDNDFEKALKSEKKKRKLLEKRCFHLNQEKLNFSDQIQNLTDQNKDLKEEIESLKMQQEMEQSKMKINQIVANFEGDFYQKNISEKNFFQQHQNQIEKVVEKNDIIETNEEKEKEIHNLHKIIIKLKNSLCQIQQKNQVLRKSLKLRENELKSLQILNTNLEDKFNQFESHLLKKSNSKIKMMKLKRKILDLSATIENLRSEITKLNCVHKEEMLAKESLIKKLQESIQSNSKTYSNSYSILSTYSNSINEGNQSKSFAKNQSNLDSSICIENSIPSEISDNLKEIIENKGLKINLKIRLITKALSSYFNDLLKNKSDFQPPSNQNEENIVKSFIEKVYNLILKQFISYQNFIDNKVIRKALLERAKELVSIAESQSELNLNQDGNQKSPFKKNSDLNLNAISKIEKKSKIKNLDNSISGIKNSSDSDSSIKNSIININNNSNLNSDIKNDSKSSNKAKSNSNSSIKKRKNSSIKNESNLISDIKNESNLNSSIKNNSNLISDIKNNSDSSNKKKTNSNSSIKKIKNSNIKNESNLNSSIKNESNSKQNSISPSSKTSKSDSIKNDNEHFTTNLNCEKSSPQNNSTEIECVSQNSEQNTITHIDSISQLESKSPQNSTIEGNKNEMIENLNEKEKSIENLISNVSLFEEEEEEFLNENESNEAGQNDVNSDEEDIISGIESLVDDLKLKID